MTMLSHFAASGGAIPVYIEDVFSTYLYTGNGSTQTITNGIDLAGKGGLVWLKPRSNAPSNNLLVDTVRGANNALISNSTSANIAGSDTVTSFSSNGFSVGSAGSVNTWTYASWTFRKQPKFFDVVTYTGTGSNPRSIDHSLGSVPGFIVVKNTGSTSNWYVLHRGDGSWVQGLCLNDTRAGSPGVGSGFGTPTSTQFVVSNADTNGSGQTYVAYLFAHNAGGFGLTGTDNVISCGSYTGNGSTNGPEINLGYEPQWLLVKEAAGSSAAFIGWYMFDNMRGFTASGSNDAVLRANESAAEDPGADYFAVQPTGFKCVTTNALANESGGSYIYIAIRRGPMKTPTSGTSVFSPNAIGAVSVGTPVTTNFPVDLQIATWRGGTSSHYFYDRLRGVSSTTTEGAKSLLSDSTAAETSPTTATRMWGNTGYQVDTSWSNSVSIFHNFRRAPGFFDEVCYTGTGTTFNQQHNLAAVPGLVICKRRNGADSWFVYADGFGGSNARLNSTDPFGSVMNRITAATSTTFTIAGGTEVNQSGGTYVAYLFASCPGVSKVGSYTGNGSSQTINCGFTGGARFVMIKRTDSTGDWYVWDTARGIISGNDPYLLLNSTAAEVTSTDYISPQSSGFGLTASAPAALNASGGSYIYLAIA